MPVHVTIDAICTCGFGFRDLKQLVSIVKEALHNLFEASTDIFRYHTTGRGARFIKVNLINHLILTVHNI